MNSFSGVHGWSEKLDNGNFRLLDPLLGERIRPDALPPSLAQIEGMNGCLDYLEGQGHRLTVVLGYGAQRNATDLGDIEGGQFEWEVNKADFYGYAGVGHDPRAPLRADFCEDIAGRPADTMEDYEATANSLQAARIDFSTFHVRSLRAITRATETRSFCYDLARSHSGIESQLLHAYERLWNLEDSVENIAALLGLANFREWMALINTAKEVRSDQRSRVDAPIRLFETANNGNRDLARKFGTLGIEAQEEDLAPVKSHEQRVVFSTVQSVLSTGVLTSGQALDLSVAALKTHVLV